MTTPTEDSSPRIWRPPLYFGVLSLLLLAGSAYEIGVRQPLAFGNGYAGLDRYSGIAAAALGMATGGGLALTWRNHAPDWFPRLLLAASLGVGASGSLLFLSFTTTEHAWLRLVITFGVALPLGVCAPMAHRAQARLWRQLELFGHLLSPFRLLALLVFVAILAVIVPLIGLLRSALVAGGLLALLAHWYCQLHWFLHGRALPRAKRIGRGAVACMLSCAAMFLFSELWVSREQLGYFQSTIVMSKQSERSELVVTTGPSGWQLFVNRSLRAGDVDSHRYFEALVHPALSVNPHARKVLILGMADGFVEYEVLRHPSVQDVIVVTEDLTRVDVLRRIAWLSERTASALWSPKLNLIEAEPIVWLSGERGEYDVILADLPDPTTPRWGKNYTRYFFQRLASHLAPSGALALQAGPTFGAARAFANIERTLESAGLRTRPYHAGIPSIGDWGFILAGHTKPALPTELALPARFLTPATLEAMFAMPRDSRAKPSLPSTLYDQRVVRFFNEDWKP